jgi:hypothetical protein
MRATRIAWVVLMVAVAACFPRASEDGVDAMPDAMRREGRAQCADGIDNDDDGLVDCDDIRDCHVETCPERCDDDADNDGNGTADCSDVSCHGSAPCVEEGPECSDGIDNDHDNSIDCIDRNCDNMAPCGDDCTNHVDDDGDGAVDCADSDCTYKVECVEVCDNGLDDDVDGLTDCVDWLNCWNDPACAEDCSNGLDDDYDGDTDCADVYGMNQCSADPVCHETAAECDDMLDNDGDGSKDCADSECGDTPPCTELCNNNVDDDRDGKVDCADAGYSCNWLFGCQPIDCQSDPVCHEAGAECADGLDNDEDGATDCQDPECDLEANCPEDCTNATDDDADGRVDCADGRCRTHTTCIESGNCSDGIDNDLDGKTDCRDTSECSTMEPCKEATHCDDGTDNDFDGNIDCEQYACDAVTTCTAAGGCTSAVTATLGTYQGDTTLGSNGHTGTCETGTAGEVEDIYRYTPTQTGVLFARAGGLDDVVLYARTTCDTASTELACIDEDPFGYEAELLGVNVTSGVPVYVFVDGGFFADGGQPYTLSLGFATALTEAEPNDFSTEANPYASPFVGVLDEYDRDYVEVRMNVPGLLVAEVTDLGDGTCAANILDTRVTIMSASSTLSTDEDSGTGMCSRASATVLPGTYYVVVEPRGQTTKAAYRLAITAP